MMQTKESRKEFILENLDLSCLKLYDKIETPENIESLELSQLADNLFRMSDRRLNKKDREVVFNLVKRIKERVGSLSLEYLRYLLMTSGRFNHRDAIRFLTSQYGRSQTKEQIRKIRKILHEHGKVRIKPYNKYYKEIKPVKGSLQVCRGKRAYHFIEF